MTQQKINDLVSKIVEIAIQQDIDSRDLIRACGMAGRVISECEVRVGGTTPSKSHMKTSMQLLQSGFDADVSIDFILNLH